MSLLITSITLTVNSNSPTKRQTLAEQIKKNKTICCLQKYTQIQTERMKLVLHAKANKNKQE